MSIGDLLVRGRGRHAAAAHGSLNFDRAHGSLNFDSPFAAIAPAALMLIVGGVFLGHQSMWIDDSATWINSIQPVRQILRNCSHIDAVFIPYYIFMHFWMAVSQSAWWLRFPSLLAGVVAVAGVTLLARRWVPGRWAVLVGLMLAVNPFFLRWSLQARPYSIDAMFAVLSTAALVSALDRPSAGRWARYGLASLGIIAFHLFGCFVLAGHVIAVLVSGRRNAWRGMVPALAFAVVCISPIILLARKQTVQVSWIGRTTPITFVKALGTVGGGTIDSLALSVCVIIVALAFFSAPAGSDARFGAALAIAWAWGAPFVLVLVSFAHPFYVNRYTMVAVPGVSLVEGMAAWHLWMVLSGRSQLRGLTSLGRWLAARWTKIAVAAVGALVLVLMVFQTGQVAAETYYDADYRGAAEVFNQEFARHPAAILVTPSWGAAGFSRYVAPAGMGAEMMSQVAALLNSHQIDWQNKPIAGNAARLQESMVVNLPASKQPVGHRSGCAVGWVLGTGVPTTLNFTFSVNGTVCRLANVTYYGVAWIASAVAASPDLSCAQ